MLDRVEAYQVISQLESVYSASLIRVPQLVVQVEYAVIDEENAFTSQVLSQTEYTEPPQIEVSQGLVQVESSDVPSQAVSQIVSQVEVSAANNVSVPQLLAQIEISKGSTPNWEHPIVTVLCAIHHITDDAYRVATSFYVSGDGTVYNPGLSFPDYADELSDVFYGIQNSGNITLSIDLTAYGTIYRTFLYHVQNHEMRGRTVTLTRYDPDIGELSGEDTDYVGIIESYEYTDTTLTINVKIEDDPIFDKLLPSQLVTTDLFDATAVDVGRPINIPIGHCRDVPLLNIKNDTTTDTYEYLIGYGPIEGLWAGTGLGVKRDGVLVNEAEYTFVNGTYAKLVFAVEQKDFSGSFHNLTADVKGKLMYSSTTATRDFPTVARFLLEDPLLCMGDAYGVNPDSLLAAAVHMSAITWKCDINIGGDQKAAKDWIADIFSYTPLTMYRSYTGEWVFNIDRETLPSHYFGYRDGYYENCKVLRNYVTSASEALKQCTIQYGFASSEDGELHYEITAGVYYPTSEKEFGIDKTIQLKAVREHVTAKEILSRVVNINEYSHKWIDIETNTDGKTVRKGDVLRLYSAYPDTYQDYIVHSTNRNFSGEFAFSCRVYSDLLYENHLSIEDPTEMVDSSSRSSAPGVLLGRYTYVDDTTDPGAPVEYTKDIELGATEVAGYDIAGMLNGRIRSGYYEILRFIAVRPFSIFNNFAGSVCYSGIRATADTQFQIIKFPSGVAGSYGNVIGYMTFEAAANKAVFRSLQSDPYISFEEGSTMLIRGPKGMDLTLANLWWTIRGIKG